MGFEKYYQARNIIEDIIEKDLLGPVETNEIIVGERPADYYILGKLYPQESEADFGNTEAAAEDAGSIDSEDSISLCNNKKPASFGISICVSKDASDFLVNCAAAKYELLTPEQALYHLKIDDIKKIPRDIWKRSPIASKTFDIEVSKLERGKTKKFIVDEYLELTVLLHRVMKDDSRIITLSMVNTHKKDKEIYFDDSSQIYFQPNITVRELVPNTFSEIVYKEELSFDRDIRELNMLYQKVQNKASGHGCAVQWTMDNGLCIISSSFLPKFEVNQLRPSLRFSGDILSMKYLSASDLRSIQSGLLALVSEYRNWINFQEGELKNQEFMYADVGAENLEKCRKTAQRIQDSIKTLKEPIVFKAFKLANEAMFEQRKQSLINRGTYKTDEDIRWYPFQLAFFVQELKSFVDPESEDRKVVDLLWFPTGGGKTEAYLGIAAFCIFLRRLRYGAEGVTVLMRYTMRLLTFQQFERASSLICACEIIRKREKIKGGEIGIGLWAGQALTPNTIEIANKILDGQLEPSEEYGNPVQISKCPWCGQEIGIASYECDVVEKRMLIKCPNGRCKFHGGLPIYLIDEDIYRHAPTYIVATIDKFAQIALNEDCAKLFGITNMKRPPELIIQDELHLISGPLGTITGLYEAAIKKLSEYNGGTAKIIASTATIRNAKEQINALYASDYSQFPPQALDMNDSFFAELSDREERPARLYLGCMAIGTSPTTMMIRCMASLLYGSRYLCELDEFDEKVIDAYWTLTCYFNTLRELGGAIVRVVDDIQDRFRYLKNKKFAKKFPMRICDNRYDKYKELTSREKSEDIGKVIQQELPIPYKKDNSTYPYDFVLASNMISVGVDVSRLGSMIVVGQPKATAEYIQATSRVGRENPGIVLTTYNQAKSRDRSHYEQFTQYHASFYKYVEATSITPFADRARDRALHTLYIILCRYFVPGLFSNSDAGNYSRDLPGLQKVKEYIFDYVSIVDPEELKNVKDEISEIEEDWESKVGRQDKLYYKGNKYLPKNQVLFEPDYEEESRFRVLNTMRSVETSVEVKVKE